eukprot:TRINITY_DN43_c1_g2_i3.p1 TRINITY_DN43_c1_g2~~TRINITY_DN43_c1_g2_i3.p1  ORF type:complete len:447 (+),score=61.89 TRINITY_DN43_c1_g2_i3:169-1509(+)
MSYTLRKRVKQGEHAQQSGSTQQPPQIERDENGENENVNNEEPKRKASVLGTTIINQLLQATSLFFLLDLKSVLSLTLTSKTVFQAISPFIEQHLLFYYPQFRILRFYHPRKLLINTFNIKGLLSIPFLNNLRKVTFHDELSKAFNIKYLPSTITHLILSKKFNKKITHQLPSSISYLHFGTYYNQPLHFDDNTSILPDGLTHLTLSKKFNKQITQKLPSNLKHLRFGGEYVQPLNLEDNTSILPEGLTHLYFGFWFSYPVEGLLPQSLLYLDLGHLFRYPINDLPPNITFLKLSHSFTLPIEKFPPKLTELILNFCFTDHVPKLPHTLTRLEFGYCWNHPVDGLLPPNLKELVLGDHFDHPLEKLPSQLTSLTVGECFTHPLDKVPASVSHITIKGIYTLEEIPGTVMRVTIIRNPHEKPTSTFVRKDGHFVRVSSKSNIAKFPL